MDEPKPTNKPKIIVLAIAFGLTIAVGGLIAWQPTLPIDAEDVQDDTVAAALADKPRLGVTVTAVDGLVVHQSAGAGWTELTSDSQLAEGDQVRTGEDSRVVLTLEDGSVVRLDADTMIEITSLANDETRIEQIAGSVYSRIVPSERQYMIMMNQTSYQALAAAFVTTNYPDDSGVQVYQSSVKTSANQAAVGQGQQYYQEHSQTELKNQVTDIDLDQLLDDEFVNWNLVEDEKDAKFKDKLGVLSEAKQRLEQRAKVEAELSQAKAAAAAAKLRAEEQAKSETTRKKTSQQEPKKYQKDRVKPGKMTLWRYGNHLGWGYTGKAIHGFKIVYSHKNPNPRLGERNTQSIFLSNQYASSYRHFRNQLDFESDKTYYITVCAYTDGSEPESCVDYSRPLVIKGRSG